MAEYIEREAALHLCVDACTECKDTCAEFDGIEPDCSYCMMDRVFREMRKMQVADVAPVRHGRWISDGAGKRFGTVVRLDKDGCPVDTCHCSECGEWLTA